MDEKKFRLATRNLAYSISDSELHCRLGKVRSSPLLVCARKLASNMLFSHRHKRELPRPRLTLRFPYHHTQTKLHPQDVSEKVLLAVTRQSGLLGVTVGWAPTGDIHSFLG